MGVGIQIWVNIPMGASEAPINQKLVYWPNLSNIHSLVSVVISKLFSLLILLNLLLIIRQN